MADTRENSPRWQLDSIFPALDSREFTEARARAAELVGSLEHLTADGPARDAASAEHALKLYEEAAETLQRVGAFVSLMVSTDAFNEEALAAESALDPLYVRFSIVSKRFTAWAGTLDLPALEQESEFISGRSHALQRQAFLSGKLLPQAAEEVVAALMPTGGSAWSKLHGQLISRETVSVEAPGQDSTGHGLAALFTMQHDADRNVRRAAWEAELKLLERNSLSFAAAMNAIKGEAGELARRRGWDSALAEALYGDGIDGEILAAMNEAVREAFPLLRRYLKAKAGALGLEQLSWYDLFAPLQQAAGGTYTWEEAKEFIVTQFRSYSPDLAEFAQRTFASGWHDGPSRPGKTNGAFCASIGAVKESRILLNFGGTLNDLFTLAHELGHAFHNEQMFRRDRSPLQRRTPMTLAETASIFCETIVFNAFTEQADEAGRLAALEQDLSGAAQLVLDIHSRFLFEKGVFDRRAERELSVAELKELMLTAQQETYGDALSKDERNPFMWAHKGHYYIPGRSFYNYPYTFGWLFGLGLYAEYVREPAGFEERYADLLAASGMAPAGELAEGFGIDIRSSDFWRGSLVVLEERVAEYERLLAAA